MAIRFLTSGESHGQSLNAIIEGIPYGYELDFDFINSELASRQEGVGRGGRMKIEKDKNQGLYITVKTQADTVSGKYTGSFELVADGTVKEIPVTVNVWDFTVPDSVNTQSCFMLNRNDIMNGELDNTEEMYKTYYETMLRYRISPMYVPGYDRGIESYLQSIQYYYDRPGFSAYGIAHSSNGQDVDYIALKEMLKVRRQEVSIMLDLEVPEDELMTRLIKRGQESGRADDNEETIKKRLVVYHSQTAPLIDWYKNDGKYCHINGLGSMDGIFADICSAIDKL